VTVRITAVLDPRAFMSTGMATAGWRARNDLWVEADKLPIRHHGMG